MGSGERTGEWEGPQVTDNERYKILNLLVLKIDNPFLPSFIIDSRGSKTSTVDGLVHFELN